MPSPEQDSSLKALVAGEEPDEVLFDPITDNDSTGSCLGCAYAVVLSAAVPVAIDAAANRFAWDPALRFLSWAGTPGMVGLFLLAALSIFALIETFSPKEVFVLLTDARRLELRRRRGKHAEVLKSWEADRVRRFVLDPPGEDPQMHSGLYVMIQGEAEQIRLLESCYPRDFVEQVERRVSEICGVPSTT
jgi:hypothetical protein